LSDAVKEGKWLLNLLEEFMPWKKSTVLKVLSDNQAAIAIAQNDVDHQRTKHIDIRHHFIRENVKNGLIQLQWINTNDQLADILTKALQKNVLNRLVERIMTKTNDNLS